MSLSASLLSLLLVSTSAKGSAPCPDVLAQTLAIENGRWPIKKIRMHRPQDRLGNQSAIEILKPFFEERPDVVFQIIATQTQHSMADLSREIGRVWGASSIVPDIQILTTPHEVYLWAQDDSKPFLDSNRVLVPYNQKENAPVYKNAIEALQNHQTIDIVEGSFAFEGGDLIVGDRHVFIGSRSLHNSISHRNFHRLPGNSKASILREIEAIAHKPGFAVITANTRAHEVSQALFHLDVVMAVVWDHLRSKEVIVLSSTTQAVRALRSVRPEQDDYPAAQSLLDIFKNESKFYRDLRIQIELIQEDLEAAGYEVISVPGFYLPPRVERKIGMHHPLLTSLYSYTNVVLDSERAIIPQTGLKVLDSAAAEIYRGLGYKIHGYDSFYPYRLHGGPRCLMNVCR